MTKIFLSLGLICAVGSLSSMGTKPQNMQQGQATQGTWYDAKLRNRIAKGQGVIYLYNVGQPYYEFTNFYEGAPITIDKYLWPTPEQYYQAGKYESKGKGIEIRHLIRTGSHPQWKDRKPANKSWGAWAFYIANQSPEVQAKATKRTDWNDTIKALNMPVNINRMLVALRAKFEQDPKLQKQLLDTYPKILVEDSDKDAYFGAGDPNNKSPQRRVAQGAGQNILGRMLMHVRRELFRKRQFEQQQRKLPAAQRRQITKADYQRRFDVNNDFTLKYLLTGKPI